MDRERWQQVDALLKSALERPEGERAAFIERACAGDEGLRREVESLVAHDESDSFMPTKPMAAFAGRIGDGPVRIAHALAALTVAGRDGADGRQSTSG